MGELVEQVATAMKRRGGILIAESFWQEIAKAAVEEIARYYEGGLDAVGYGNLRATPEEVHRAQVVAAEMRRMLSK